ncbi:nitrilase-related carbon-nitrogen hydrolase [Sporomusa sp. KB1]|jgi:apolipoprotein N-acyltransferase|uniref:nitrilase-related carbon-nitrogen hydrolase n=1 Tax=Sporomusa sp. KB1 TaxID=943346 RepID=UPI0011A2F990|nr:nitrilase-related carbon-nitrogen hydrolase [Sporomusa sp. KB1]TWH52129.1 apolipoprotein N-acyltransferase [Sporomusa sp. KB1]
MPALPSKIFDFSFFTVCLSAILFYFSTGFYDYWLLTWLAPLPVCLFALHSRTVETALAAFTAFILGAMNQFGYLPLLLFAGTTLLNATAFALSVLLFRTTARSTSQPFAPFAFAAAWTAYEFVRSHFSSFGTFESLAYTQALNLPVIQLASLTGIWGITFFLMLIPAGLAAVWHAYRTGNRWRLTGLLVGGLLAAVFLFGVCRLYLPADNPVITIGLSSVPATREEMRSQDIATITASLRRYSRSVDTLAAAGAQFVLLPEKIAFLNPAVRETGLSILSQAAGKNRVTLIAGLSLQEERLRNVALAFAPDGSLLRSYDKQHLLSPYENSYVPGKDLALLETGAATSAGIAICKDMDFVLPAREYSWQGTGLLLVPALDFHADGWLHARVAVLRGVEGNAAVVRAAQWGLLTVSDSRGRLLGTEPASGQDEANLLAKVPLSSGYSLYSRLGDWLGWLCLLGTALALFRPRMK